MKKWELIVEATAFDGSQTFACEAKDEDEAVAKFKSGECEIIEVNVEVIGLSNEPMDIEESDDISSRLSSDINSRLIEENAELRKQLKDSHEWLGINAGYKGSPLCVNNENLLNK